MTSVITGTKTIMQEPLAHLLKIRHGRQSTHDLQSLLPVTELGPVCPRSITQRERRNAIRSGDPRMPETRRSNSREEPPVHNGEHPPLSRRRAHASQPGRHRQPGDHPVACRDVFAVSEFRALWSAQALSCAGDQFAQVAIAFVVYARTGSPFLTAAAYALTYLPPVLGGPALSGLADLVPRQQLMITLDLIRAGLVALMALRGLPFAGLCLLFFSTVLLGTPFSSARSALLPEVLPGEKYPLGTVIGSHTTQLSQIAGFLAGGGLVAALGPYRALALDSLSFSLSAGILACGVRPRPAPPPSTGRPSPWEITWEGTAAVFGSPVLRTLVLFGWLAGFTVVPEALAAPYAHTLGGGAATIGLLMAAMPAGTVIGGFVIGRLLRPSDPVAADGLAGHAVLRAADLQPGPPAAAGPDPALGSGRRGWRLPAGGGRGVRHGPARRAPGARVRGRPVRAAGRAGPGHPDRRCSRPADRADRGGRPGRVAGPAGRRGPGHRLDPPAHGADRLADERAGDRRRRGRAIAGHRSSRGIARPAPARAC